MLNPQILSFFHLEKDRIQRDMQASIAAARYYRESHIRNKNNVAFGATSLRRAAAHSLLISKDSEINDTFRDSADAYRELGMLYCFMMLIFIKDSQKEKVNLMARDYIRSLENHITMLEELDDLEGKLQKVYLLMATTNRNWRLATSNSSSSLSSQLNIVKIRQDLEKYRKVPIGLLGIPAGNYLDLFDTLQRYRITIADQHQDIEIGDDDIEAIQRVLLPFLIAYDNGIKNVIADRYHWERLATPFHPAEPDIFSVLLYTYKAIRPFTNQGKSREIFQYSLLSDNTRILLNGILENYYY